MRRALGSWLTRPGRTPRRLRAALAALLGALALAMLASPPQAQPPTALAQPAEAAAPSAGANSPGKLPLAPRAGEPQLPRESSPALLAEGRTLFNEGCASCHGFDLRGRKGLAPALIGVGAGPPDFYLSTGRMPLSNPGQEPLREGPHYSPARIRALVAYVASFGGPGAPLTEPAKGDLALGFHAFTLNCAGCHQAVARGGLTVGAVVPSLQQASAQQIGEAVRMGPYLMPRFSAQQIDQHELDSIARYVLWTRAPANNGGWGIYNIGPIPEGMVAWFLALFALVLVARLIGERTA